MIGRLRSYLHRRSCAMCRRAHDSRFRGRVVIVR